MNVAATVKKFNKVQVVHNFGPKQPPISFVSQRSLSLSECKIEAWAEEISFDFLKKNVTKRECLEYNGYCGVSPMIKAMQFAQKQLFKCSFFT